MVIERPYFNKLQQQCFCLNTKRRLNFLPTDSVKDPSFKSTPKKSSMKLETFAFPDYISKCIKLKFEMETQTFGQ